MVRLEEHKTRTEDKAIERMPLSPRVTIPLIQHLGKAGVAEVKPADIVFVGQRIAYADAHVFAPIHASVSGKVVGIADSLHPVLGRSKAIIIDNDGKDTLFNKTPVQRSREEVENFTADQIRKAVFDAGIVGLGGAGFPTHIKLNPPKPVEYLVINGAECEPYLTGDYRLMIEHTEEIIAGIEILSRCLRVKKIYIAIEDNKPEAIEKFTVHGSQFIVRALKTEYPQGGEKQLIKKILNKEVPQGKLPFDVGVVVQNVATVFAVYEAVYLNKPLYERVLTVTGSCLSSPRNLMVRLGTPVRDLIEFCGPLKEEPAKIVIGGPMMGIAQYTADVPVIKTTTGVVLLNEDEAAIRKEIACIRCGACIRACPVGLMPCIMNLASLKELWSQVKDYGAMDCIECGCCNYVCPAARNIVQTIKRAKLEIAK